MSPSSLRAPFDKMTVMETTIMITAVICVVLVAIPDMIEVWKHCITANHAKLSWQDHEDRIRNWKGWLLGVATIGFCYGSILSLAYLFTGNQLWATWSALGLTLNFGFSCYIIFVLQLHIRHQSKKKPINQAVLAGK